MSKTCPNCGVNSPDNAKFCIECAYDLSEVPVNKEEKPKETPKNDSDDGNAALGCIIMIAIVVVIAVVAGFFLFGSSSETPEETIQITFDEVKVSDFTSDGKVYYNYGVTGFITNFPDDIDKYMLKTVYYDSNGNQLISTTEKLSQFKGYDKYSFPASISFYQTQNYLNVDHVSVQVIKDNTVVKEFNSTVNTNTLSSTTNNTV